MAWIRSIKDQCQAANVRCFVKQLGAFSVLDYQRGPLIHTPTGVENFSFFTPMQLKDKKGGAIEEWPEDLRVREWPR